MAATHKAINLGQGFPNFQPEAFVADHAAAVCKDENPLCHQYARAPGHPDLVAQITRRYTTLLDRPVGPEHVQVTNGTTQALNVAFLALVDPGDEVVLFEPFFDLYPHDVTLAGGTCKFVSLMPHGTTANEWKLDIDALRKACVRGKTKMIVLNTPMNVPGKVWSVEEMKEIAAVAEETDCLVISDEVYDRLVYPDAGQAHVSFASLPGMWERTITMASCGKTFTVTGWKIGWTVAPPAITLALGKVAAHQTFSVATPLQIAAARAYADAETNGYYGRLADSYLRRRDALCAVLKDVGLPPLVPQGSFFVLADISNVDPAHYLGAGGDGDDATAQQDVGKDWRFCRWLTREIGVCAIPTTAFVRPESRPMYDRYARFAFCKTEDEIKVAGERLKKLRDFMIPEA